jgi:WD40 repeat protein
MNSQHYQVLSRRIYNNFPLIGRLLRGWATRRLAKDRTSKAIKILAEAVTKSKDQNVVAIALDALKQLKNYEMIDAFCEVWATSRNKELEIVLKNHQYVSSELSLKVLTALKVGKTQFITDAGVDILNPLLSATKDKDTEIAESASFWITKISNTQTINELCKRWFETRDIQLEKIIEQGNYIATNSIEIRVFLALKFNKLGEIEDGIDILDPLISAISDRDSQIVNNAIIYSDNLRDESVQTVVYFLTDQWQKFDNLDIDRNLLDEAFKSSSKESQNRIIEKVKTTGKSESKHLKLFIISNYESFTDCMTDDHWQEKINILLINQHKNDIWQFLQTAPPIHSKNLLIKLQPFPTILCNSDERVILDALIESANGIISEVPFIKINRSKTIAITDSEFYSSLALSADGNILASGIFELKKASVRLWSLPEGNCTKVLSFKRFEPYSSAMSPNGKYLVTSNNNDGIICLWSLADEKCFKTLESHTSKVYSLQISPDGRLLVSISRDRTIKIWSFPEGKCLKTLEEPNGGFGLSAISPDGKLLISTKDDKSIWIWSLPDCNHYRVLGVHKGKGVRSLTISSSNKILVLGHSDGFIQVWSIHDGICLTSMDEHIMDITGLDEDICSLSISTDDKVIISSGYDRKIRFWSLPSGELIKTYKMGSFNWDQNRTFTEIINDGKVLISTSRHHTHIFDMSITHVQSIPLKNISTTKIEEIKSELKNEVFLRYSESDWAEESSIKCLNANKFIIALHSLSVEITQLNNNYKLIKLGKSYPAYKADIIVYSHPVIEVTIYDKPLSSDFFDPLIVSDHTIKVMVGIIENKKIMEIFFDDKPFILSFKGYCDDLNVKRAISAALSWGDTLLKKIHPFNPLVQSDLHIPDHNPQYMAKYILNLNQFESIRIFATVNFLDDQAKSLFEKILNNNAI